MDWLIWFEFFRNIFELNQSYFVEVKKNRLMGELKCHFKSNWVIRTTYNQKDIIFKIAPLLPNVLRPFDRC